MHSTSKQYFKNKRNRKNKSDCLLSFFSFPNATCFDQVSIILPAVDQHFNSKTGSHFLVKSGTSLIYV